MYRCNRKSDDDLKPFILNTNKNWSTIWYVKYYYSTNISQQVVIAANQMDDAVELGQWGEKTPQ